MRIPHIIQYVMGTDTADVPLLSAVPKHRADKFSSNSLIQRNHAHQIAAASGGFDLKGYQFGNLPPTWRLFNWAVAVVRPKLVVPDHDPAHDE